MEKILEQEREILSSTVPVPRQGAAAAAAPGKGGAANGADEGEGDDHAVLDYYRLLVDQVKGG